MFQNDPDMWSATLLLLEACGSRAPVVASKRAMKCLDDNDVTGHDIWLAIRDAAGEMLRTRRNGEQLN